MRRHMGLLKTIACDTIHEWVLYCCSCNQRWGRCPRPSAVSAEVITQQALLLPLEETDYLVSMVTWAWGRDWITICTKPL